MTQDGAPASPTNPAQHALLAGLTPLIPLPFVDGILHRRILRSAYGKTALEAGLPLDPPVLKALSNSRGSILLGCILAVLWWPIKKLLKTILYFLTVKECFDVAAQTALRIEMVRMAVSRGLLPVHVEPVRLGMDAACKAKLGSPVTRFLLRKGGDPVTLPPGDPVTPAVEALARHAGGHAALEAFALRLDAIDAGPAAT